MWILEIFLDNNHWEEEEFSRLSDLAARHENLLRFGYGHDRPKGHGGIRIPPEDLKLVAYRKSA